MSIVLVLKKEGGGERGGEERGGGRERRGGEEFEKSTPLPKGLCCVKSSPLEMECFVVKTTHSNTIFFFSSATNQTTGLFDLCGKPI